MMWLALAAPQPRSTLGDEGLLTMMHFTAAPLSVRTLTLAAAMFAALAVLDGISSSSAAQDAGTGAPVVEFPTVDPARGRELFVSKGCVDPGIDVGNARPEPGIAQLFRHFLRRRAATGVLVQHPGNQLLHGRRHVCAVRSAKR